MRVKLRVVMLECRFDLWPARVRGTRGGDARLPYDCSLAEA